MTLTNLIEYKEIRLQSRLHLWKAQINEGEAARDNRTVNDARARRIIMGSCCKRVLGEIRELETAQEMWELLRRRYRDRRWDQVVRQAEA